MAIKFNAKATQEATGAAGGATTPSGLHIPIKTIKPASEPASEPTSEPPVALKATTSGAEVTMVVPGIHVLGGYGSEAIAPHKLDLVNLKKIAQDALGSDTEAFLDSIPKMPNIPSIPAIPEPSGKYIAGTASSDVVIPASVSYETEFDMAEGVLKLCVSVSEFKYMVSIPQDTLEAAKAQTGSMSASYAIEQHLTAYIESLTQMLVFEAMKGLGLGFDKDG